MSLCLNPLRPSLFDRAVHGARGAVDPKVLRLAAGRPAVRGPEDRSRSYTSPLGVEAEDLTLAYLRYIELHGHALSDPRSGCSMSSRRSGRAETRTFGFWSRKAARGFDEFWERYRLVYGHAGHDGRAAA